MHKIRSIVFCVLCASLLWPAQGGAQVKEEADDFVKDIVKTLFGPNWNVSVHGGTSSSGRFLLQQAGGGERAVRTDGGYSIGVGAGIDILLRMGVRFGYSYGNTDLVFRTDDGDDSRELDIDVGELDSHIVSFELMRYLLTSRASISPYASVGFVGSWWSADSGTGAVLGDTQFRWGGLGSFGIKFKLSEHFDLRTEATSASIRNPFTGRESFRVVTGATIDEPTHV